MKIAIVRLSAMGDILQTMVVLQYIKARYPMSEIDWFIESKFYDLLQGNSDIRNIIPINLEEIRTKKSIYKFFKLTSYLRNLQNYDLVIDFQGLIKSAIISKFIPSKRTIGFSRGSIKEKFAAYFYNEKYSIPYEENVIRRYLFLLENSLNLNISDEEVRNKKPFFFLSKRNKENKDFKILIIIGASFPSKIYPIANYLEIIRNVDADFEVIWGSDNEKKLANELGQKDSKVRISKKLTMNGLKKKIWESDLVIGGDTGPTHLAWSMNIPSITIFGPTIANRNCFISDINLAIDAENQINVFKINKSDRSINSISPKSIVNLILSLRKNL